MKCYNSFVRSCLCVLCTQDWDNAFFPFLFLFLVGGFRVGRSYFVIIHTISIFFCLIDNDIIIENKNKKGQNPGTSFHFLNSLFLFRNDQSENTK